MLEKRLTLLTISIVILALLTSCSMAVAGGPSAMASSTSPATSQGGTLQPATMVPITATQPPALPTSTLTLPSATAAATSSGGVIHLPIPPLHPILPLLPSPVPTATLLGFKIHIPIVPIHPIFPANPSSSMVTGGTSVSAGSSGEAVASCPSGTVITGGGYGGSVPLLVYSSAANGNSWSVDGWNPAATGSIQLTAVAICLQNTSLTTQQEVTQVAVPSGTVGTSQTSCPAGSILTGGGYASNPDFRVFLNAEVEGPWMVSAQNTSTSSELLNSYAICLSGSSGSSQEVMNQAMVPSGGFGMPVATCPAKTIPTGGGFALGMQQPATSDSAGMTGWDVLYNNGTGMNVAVTAYAMCLTLP